VPLPAAYTTWPLATRIGTLTRCVGLEPLLTRRHMRSGPCVCVPGVRKRAGRGGKTNTCRSCRLSRSWGILGRIGLASAIRAPILRIRSRLLLLYLLLCLLAGIGKLEATLNSMSRFATEGTHETGRWSGCLRASRGRCSGSSGDSSSSSNPMRLFVFEGILDLLHCQFGLCKQVVRVL